MNCSVPMKVMRVSGLAREDLVGDRLHEVRLAEPGVAVDEERVVDLAGRLGDGMGGRGGELVRLSDDEVVERVSLAQWWRVSAAILPLQLGAAAGGGATNRSICGRAFRSSVTERRRRADGRARPGRGSRAGRRASTRSSRRRTDLARRRRSCSRRATSASVGSSQVLNVCSGSSWRARSSRRLQASWAVSVMSADVENSRRGSEARPAMWKKQSARSTACARRDRFVLRALTQCLCARLTFTGLLDAACQAEFDARVRSTVLLESSWVSRRTVPGTSAASRRTGFARAWKRSGDAKFSAVAARRDASASPFKLPTSTQAPDVGARLRRFRARQRLTRGADLQTITREGKRIRTAYLDVRVARFPSRAVRAYRHHRARHQHSAVDRNRLKRRLRELARTRPAAGASRDDAGSAWTS